MKCQVLLLFGILIKIGFIKTEETETIIEGYLLCKSCGEDNTILNLIDNTQISSTNQGLKNITFGQKEVLIQQLQNQRGIDFKVLITKKAKCSRTTSNWFTEATWFDGYAWKICLCPNCKSHVGWMFEPFELAYDNPIFPSDKGFYAIVVDSIISESYVNSLLMVDKVLRNEN